MNDPRIDAFLDALRRDLRDFFPARMADERLLEMRGHLQEAVAQAEEKGVGDPVGTALMEFGDEAYRRGAETSPLPRLQERTALRWAAALLLVPIAADLAMDFSSWLTGSDSGLYAIGIPIILFLGLRFAIASSRVRRFLAAPLLSLILGSFLAYAALGGLARGTAYDGLSGTRPRGTAFQRRNGLLKDALPMKKALLADLQRGGNAFVPDHPAGAIGEYRVASGYLVPTIEEKARESWRGDPRADRWLIEGLRYAPVTDYAVARGRWRADAPALLRLARFGVQGEQAEIDELATVVGSLWWTAVRADADSKTAMGLVAGAFILTLHLLGLAAGSIARRRRRVA